MISEVMPNTEMNDRWMRFLHESDSGFMVSPLVDGWFLDQPFYWPYDHDLPLPLNGSTRAVVEQIAAAGICGYDPLFMISAEWIYDHPLPESVYVHANGGKNYTNRRIETPLGCLTSLFVQDLAQKASYMDQGLIKAVQDYPAYRWYIQERANYNRQASIQATRKTIDIVRRYGPAGISILAPGIVQDIQINDIFLHVQDYEDEYDEVFSLQQALLLDQLEIFREMGIDFLFCAVPGTELSSPTLFEKYFLGSCREIISKWQELGGFFVWHTCGFARTYVEKGYYNQLGMNILETLSETPVGDIPSLQWARSKLDPRIITKGNLDLSLLKSGPPDEIREAVRAIKRQCGQGRHIIAGTDDILQGTPAEHIRVMVEEARCQIN